MAAIFDDLETKLDDIDLDRLENGLAKDLIPDNCLDPTPRGKLDSNTSHINMSMMDNNELWQQCYIYRPEKGQYRMYDEASGQMLLSATRTNLGDYLISRYEDFPEQYAESTSSTAAKMWSSLSGTPQAHQTSGHEKSTTTNRLPKYVATMRLNSARNGYKLYTSSCELCDEALQKFSCTGTSLEAKPRVTAGISPYTVPASGASTTSPRNNSTRRNSGSGFASYGDDANRHQVDPDEDRQLLAVITQSMNVIDGTDIPARYMTFEIPGFLDSCGKTHKEQSRIVWCPRTLNNATKAETPAQVQQRLTHCDVRMRRGSIVTDPAYTTGGGASPGRSRRMSTLFTEKVSDQERLRYKVRLPSWSDDIGSLVLTFHGNRVLQPSAKNFMMIEDSTESIDGGNDPRLVFQFGKVNRDRFNLDFKYPVSPLQAFALALSSFKFTAK